MPSAAVNFRVSCNVKIKGLKVAVVRCQFLWYKAWWSQSGSFFPDASMYFRKAKSMQLSFSNQTPQNKTTLFWGNHTLLYKLLTNTAGFPKRPTTFAKHWLMLYCRPNTWRYLCYLSSGSQCLITSAKCSGMLMMYSTRTWGALHPVPAGWPHLCSPPRGTQCVYGHVADAASDLVGLCL